MIGSGSLVEAARLPVPNTKYLPFNMVQHYDPDPLPKEAGHAGHEAAPRAGSR